MIHQLTVIIVQRTSGPVGPFFYLFKPLRNPGTTEAQATETKLQM